MANEYRQIASITRSASKAIEEVLKVIGNLSKDCNNPFYKSALQKIAKEVEKSAAEEGTKQIPFISVKDQYFPEFVGLLKQNGVDFVPFDSKSISETADPDRKFILYNPKDAEIVEMCRNIALLEKGKLYEVPFEDFMKHSYKDEIIKIKNKDELWLNKFNAYARKFNLNYTVDRKENGKFEIIAKKEHREKLNKAVYCTNWDFSGRFKNIERKIAESNLLRQEAYKERMSKIFEKGDVYLVNINNTNERLQLHKDGYTLYHKDTIVSQQNVSDPEYLFNKTKLINLMGKDALLIEGHQYRETPETEREDLFREKLKEEKRIYIKREIYEKIKEEHFIRDEVIKHKDFSENLAFSRDEMLLLKDNLKEAFFRAKDTQAKAIEVAKESGGKTPEMFELLYSHLNEVIIQNSQDEKQSEEVQVDITMIDLKSIEEAKELATTKALNNMIEDMRENTEREEFVHEEIIEIEELEELEEREHTEEIIMDIPDTEEYEEENVYEDRSM